jgi:hypothetical protein
MNYKKQIERYKELRKDFNKRKSLHNVSISNKELKSMLIQLKRSIMIKRNLTTENQILFKSEFPEE